MIAQIYYKFDLSDEVLNTVNSLGFVQVGTGYQSCHSCSTQYHYIELRVVDTRKLRVMAEALKGKATIKLTI